MSDRQFPPINFNIVQPEPGEFRELRSILPETEQAHTAAVEELYRQEQAAQEEAARRRARMPRKRQPGRKP